MKVLAFLMAIWLCCNTQADSQTTEATAAQVKAVFLFNFAQFIQWPEKAFEGDNSPLVIGILGDDPFGDYLEELIKNESIRGRDIGIRHFERAEDIQGVQILFVNLPDDSSQKNILHLLDGHSILTVGDSDHFIRNGGMIRFMQQGNHIRFEINDSEARQSGLNISSKLLSVANIVK